VSFLEGLGLGFQFIKARCFPFALAAGASGFPAGFGSCSAAAKDWAKDSIWVENAVDSVSA